MKLRLMFLIMTLAVLPACTSVPKPVCAPIVPPPHLLKPVETKNQVEVMKDLLLKYSVIQPVQKNVE